MVRQYHRHVKQREHIFLHWATELHNNARLAIYKHQEGSVSHNTPHCTLHCVVHCQETDEHWISEIANIGTQTLKIDSQTSALNTTHNAIYNRAVHSATVHGTMHSTVCNTSALNTTHNAITLHNTLYSALSRNNWTLGFCTPHVTLYCVHCRNSDGHTFGSNRMFNHFRLHRCLMSEIHEVEDGRIIIIIV